MKGRPSSACEVIEDHICVHNIEFVDGDYVVDYISPISLIQKLSEEKSGKRRARESGE